MSTEMDGVTVNGYTYGPAKSGDFGSMARAVRPDLPTPNFREIGELLEKEKVRKVSGYPYAIVAANNEVRLVMKGENDPVLEVPDGSDAMGNTKWEKIGIASPRQVLALLRAVAEFDIQ